MNLEISTKIEEHLHAFRLFSEDKIFSSCRLVHYIGVDRPNAIDIPIREVEREISGCLAEGFLIGWLYNKSRLFLWVQEPGFPIPPFEKVIEEEALVDIDSLLREAGFTDGA
ncbi:hypothetical protein [Plesiomonas shigelloides]|uniref:Uncharacterized protein n=1 Tax=Plesiomonas shigelloides 302-73 TaxID=1315976 RepID=R8AVS6_PLESH|nr:hypothetical protein [Plesiomonas shigelloides]EON90401.1 hypothetical protein PLESHI_00270 [Plesiomonas shigelloides 302-73]KAB7714914.1 hypothetical protein GBN32_01880 [Plesiomonas shigelloides]SUB63582.1 Uncharacterised protein [Plesiomonas shigelloides]